MEPYPVDHEEVFDWVEEGEIYQNRNIEGLKVYQIAMEVGEQIWKEVDRWPYFAKDTIGKQLIRAVDSVAANLAEGHGRYSFKENLRFCFYSRGSLVETQTWLRKAHNRDLISQEIFQQFHDQLTQARKMINGYIRYIRKANAST